MRYSFDPSASDRKASDTTTARDDRTEEEIQYAAENCKLWGNFIWTGSMFGGAPYAVPLKDSVDLGRENILGAYFYCYDWSVSRKHLVFEEEDGQCFVRDRGSTNGTFVNGKRVVRLALRNQDIVRAGSSLVVISDRRAGGAVQKPDGGEFSWCGEFGKYLEQIVRPRDQSGTLLVVGKPHSGKRALVHAARAHLAPSSNIVELQLDLSWRSGISKANRLLDSIARCSGSKATNPAMPSTHLLQCNAGELGPKVLHRRLLPLAERLSAMEAPVVRLLLTFDVPGDAAVEEFREKVCLLPVTQVVEVPPLLRSREEIGLFVAQMATLIPGDPQMSVEFFEGVLLHHWRHHPSQMADQVCAALQRAASAKRVALPADLQASARTPAVQRPTKRILLQALCEHNFNVRAAADAHHWKRRQVYRWIAALGIELPRVGRRGVRRDLEN